MWKNRCFIVIDSFRPIVLVVLSRWSVSYSAQHLQQSPCMSFVNWRLWQCDLNPTFLVHTIHTYTHTIVLNSLHSHYILFLNLSEVFWLPWSLVDVKKTTFVELENYKAVNHLVLIIIWFCSAKIDQIFHDKKVTGEIVKWQQYTSQKASLKGGRSGNILTFSKTGVALADDGLQWTRKSRTDSTGSEIKHWNNHNHQLMNNLTIETCLYIVCFFSICLLVITWIIAKQQGNLHPTVTCFLPSCVLPSPASPAFSKCVGFLYWTSRSTLWILPPFQPFTSSYSHWSISWMENTYDYFWHLFRNFTLQQQFHHPSNCSSHYIIRKLSCRYDVVVAALQFTVRSPEEIIYWAQHLEPFMQL